MKKILFALLLIAGGKAFAQSEPAIIPRPLKIEMQKGSMQLTAPVAFIVNDAITPGDGGIVLFKNYLRKNYGIKKFIDGDTNSYGLPTQVFLDFSNQIAEGAYELEISKKGIHLRGNASGIFYGFQTLIQLLEQDPLNKKKAAVLPFLRISDQPRFGYRGMHLDVGRHFFSVSSIKRYIDFLAENKFNRFHWHLTEDQGWRLPISRYPRLTTTGGCRAQTLLGRYGSDVYDGKPYCGAYTKAEIREVVRYAAARYISVIPEVDMPGHTQAALSAYPFLGCKKGPYHPMETWGTSPEVMCAGNDSTYAFLENVLSEVMELFPSRYIHIGGDECPKERWKACPVCQARIKKEGLKDEHELQSYFTRRIEKFVNSRGRSIIGWDEILEGGLAPNATVMSWRGESGGIAAARMQHDVIMTPEHPLYLNHTQSRNEDSITQGGYNSLEAVYQYDPVPKELNKAEAKYVLGGQGNMWTEYIDNTSKLEYMLFPRMTALAEVLWSMPSRKDWQRFQEELPIIFHRYQAHGIHYSNAYFDIQPSVIAMPGNRVGWQLESRLPSGHMVYVKDSTMNASRVYDGPLVVDHSGVYAAALEDKEHRIISNWVKQPFQINLATGKKISLVTPPNKSYSNGGAFTLVDAVQNSQGMLSSAQFLGFLGNDLEAVIDLGVSTAYQSITLHAFEQAGSWIYPPSMVEFWSSEDGINFTLLKTIHDPAGKRNMRIILEQPGKARYIKVFAKNFGLIPDGMPGAGSKAWLFVDEIEVNEDHGGRLSVER